MSKLKQFNKKLGNGVKNCFVFLKNKTKQFLSVIKKWFNQRKKHEKFIIGGVSLVTLLIIVVCCFTIDFSRLLGSVYDVEDIGANIDDIQVGDRIDYEVNNFNDWQVLNINKEDNTIDVVARTTPQKLLVRCGLSSCDNFYDTLQMTADKYVDKKYAIKARSVSEDDLENFLFDDVFWISKKSDTSLYVSKSDSNSNSYYNTSKSVNFHSGYISEVKNLYFVPVVNLTVDDVSKFNTGSSYDIVLNNINEWLILNIDVSNNTIDIVPKYAPVIDLVDLSKDGDLLGAINFEKNKYKNDKVNYVSIGGGAPYMGMLNSIGYRSYNYQYNFFSNCQQNSSNSYSSDSSIQSMSLNYKVYYYNIRYDNSTDQTIYLESYETGFRPVVTLKYSDEEKNGKDNNNKLEIGDYVKYNANAYKNWKVLDIDKENNTVDIISGGIVKNVSLEGKEDWENLEAIFQEEVDKYKVGNDAISARTVEIDDLDNLKRMKDNLSAKYFLNNKTKYRPRNNNTGVYSDYISYVVGIAYYESSVSQISNDWAILEYEDELNIYDPLVGAYRYTAGLRPIITLKLSEVEEVIDPEESVPKDDDNSSDSLINEQTEANRNSQDVIKGVEIIEEIDIKDNDSNNGDKSNSNIISNSVVKESNIKNSINSEMQDSVYREFIIFIVIIIVLTIIAIFIEKIKNWFKRCSKRKLIISGSAFVTVLVITIFGFKLNFSKVTGSVYDIDNISSNIDNIQIGDTINYSANGYSNWEVFNINKEDNTIDIVSSSAAEGLVINCIDEKCSNYHDALQEEANKYLDGKYAISSRSVREEDLDYLRNRSDYFWVDKKNDKYLYFNYYDNYNSRPRLMNTNIENELSKCDGEYVVPIVTLRVDDTSGLRAGLTYTYALNGISNWIILYIESNDIILIPQVPPTSSFGDSYDIVAAFNNKIEEFQDDNVIDVRSVSASDISRLNSISYGKNFYYYGYNKFYTNKLLSKEFDYNSSGGYIRYKFESLIKERKSNKISLSIGYCYDYVQYSGFRPIVTIKYSDEEKEGKDLETELKEGDYVKYSANGYKNWKVLNVDKKNGTVDIISGGIVKNISLDGKKDYDSFYEILQKEVNKYKKGDYAISARSVEHADYTALEKINDTLSARYLLGNKIKYKDKGAGIYGWSTQDNSGYKSVMTYAVGIGYYNLQSSALDYDWGMLEVEAVDGDSSDAVINSYKAYAGLRPVITLKLYEVEKEENPDDIIKETDKKNEILKEDQNKVNQSNQVPKPINNKKIDKESIIYIYSTIENDVSNDVNNSSDNNYESIIYKSESNSDFKTESITYENSNKRKIAITLIILSIILLALAIVLKLVKFKSLKKKDFRVK